MFRDVVFRSGIPMIIAAAGLLSFAYIALVRRERLARYWAVAWALLITRYFLSAQVSDFSNPVVDVTGSILRTGFASAILFGVLALRGKSFPPTTFLALACGLGSFGHVVWLFTGWRQFSNYWTLGVMLTLLLTAATTLWQATSLPVLERRFTAAALVGYAVLSAISPRLPDGSQLLALTLTGTWCGLLLLSFGLMAVFFRLTLESERTASRRVEQYLTRALGEFVSVCMHCRAVRDEHDQWQPLERFVAQQQTTSLSHGLCPSCNDKHYAHI